jgi:pimeloyl-ACP methyl ester carboxylesterase
MTMTSEPNELRVDVGSIVLGCLEYGSPADRPVMIFHGHADTAWSFDTLARPLAERFHVYSFDLRGHGRSDWGAYTLAHLVGDMRGAVDALELVEPIVVGHSLGGQAASQFCGTFPEIPRAVVLIEALGPPPSRRAAIDPDDYQRSSFRRIADQVRQPVRAKSMASRDEAITRFMAAHPLLEAERAAFLVEKATEELPDGTLRWRFDPRSRDWIAGHDHDRAEQRWRGVTCPTQIILGRESWPRFWQPSIPTSADLDGPMSETELGRRLANFGSDHVEYVEVEGAGHMIHYERPAELNAAVLGFLDRI